VFQPACPTRHLTQRLDIRRKPGECMGRALVPVERGSGQFSVRDDHAGDAILGGGQKAFGREQRFFTMSKQMWEGL